MRTATPWALKTLVGRRDYLLKEVPLFRQDAKHKQDQANTAAANLMACDAEIADLNIAIAQLDPPPPVTSTLEAMEVPPATSPAISPQWQRHLTTLASETAYATPGTVDLGGAVTTVLEAIALELETHRKGGKWNNDPAGTLNHVRDQTYIRAISTVRSGH